MNAELNQIDIKQQIYDKVKVHIEQNYKNKLLRYNNNTLIVHTRYGKAQKCVDLQKYDLYTGHSINSDHGGMTEEQLEYVYMMLQAKIMRIEDAIDVNSIIIRFVSNNGKLVMVAVQMTKRHIYELPIGF